ncbi:MAG: FeoA family protein [Clostridia bacterium]|jgi:ferrous iron transport protein A
MVKLMKTSLNTIALNTPVKIKYLNCSGSIKRRLLDLGLIEGSTIVPILKSPAGELTAYEIHGTVIAIRMEDAKNIIVII